MNLKYANEKNQQIWEEWNKTEHKIEKWPDKSNIPEELDRMYSNINMIKRYENNETNHKNYNLIKEEV